MDNYLNKAIIDVIGEFPEVGVLLNGYGVSCVTCSVGICLLKDVLSIHSFKKAEEGRIMDEIRSIIENGENASRYSDRFPAHEVQDGVKRKFEYSKPVEVLVDEHDNIKRVLGAIPGLLDEMRAYDAERTDGISSIQKEKVVLNSILYFIRNYADKYHHAKEEDILFKYTDEAQEIIQAMYDDHKAGRSFIQTVHEGIDEDDFSKVESGLLGYMEILTGHIQREDDVLYPWFDKNLSSDEVRSLEDEFEVADNKAGKSFVEGILIFIDGLEKRFKDEI
jgi:hemerythrin-like domain-containing protein